MQNLILVTGPPFYCQCIECGKYMLAGNGHRDCQIVYANVHGAPFKDYYCKPCASAKNVKETQC